MGSACAKVTRPQRQKVPPVMSNVNCVLLVDVLFAEYPLSIENPKLLSEEITSFFQR